MIAIVAAAGAGVGRFDGFRESARRLGGTFVEHVSTGDVRLGTVTPPAAAVDTAGFRSGHVLQVAESEGRALAALGSGLTPLGPAAAATLLGDHGRSGRAAFDRMPDDIAALIADAATGTLVIAAGAGNHRVFIAELAGGLMASTHLGILAAALGNDLRLDRSYEDFLLGFGFLPDGRTPYEGVHAHPGGSARVWPDGATHAIAPAAVAIPDVTGDPVTVRRALHDTFVEVLEEQAAGRRSHAVLLGGFDSALVAAGLRRLGHDVDCYTFAFGDARYEQRNAALLAAEIGARHTRVEFTCDVIGSALESYADLVNQPGAQPHYLLHTTHASRVIAGDGHDNVFTGDGCDAVFLGYPTVSRRARLVSRLGALPAFVRHGLLSVAAANAAERRLGHVARMTRSTLRSLELPWPARGHLPTQYLDETALRRLRRDTAPAQRESVRDVRLRLAAGLEELDPVRLAFHGNGLTGQSRAKVEAAVAASGVAQFSPFLHPRLKALAAALPVSLLRPAGSASGGAGKAVLVDMVRERGLLPESIIAMPKQSPSDSPIDEWYAGPLRPLVFRMLDRLPFEWNRSYVEELLAHKRVEDVFRERISLGHHALQAIGLLCSYGSFTARAR